MYENGEFEKRGSGAILLGNGGTSELALDMEQNELGYSAGSVVHSCNPTTGRPDVEDALRAGVLGLDFLTLTGRPH